MCDACEKTIERWQQRYAHPEPSNQQEILLSVLDQIKIENGYTEAEKRAAATRDGFPPLATAGAPDRIRAGRQRPIPDPTLITAWCERTRTTVLDWQHSHAREMVPAEFGAWSAVEAAITSLAYATSTLVQTQAVGKAVREQAAARNAGQL